MKSRRWYANSGWKQHKINQEEHNIISAYIISIYFILFNDIDTLAQEGNVQQIWWEKVRKHESNDKCEGIRDLEVMCHGHKYILAFHPAQVLNMLTKSQSSWNKNLMNLRGKIYVGMHEWRIMTNYADKRTIYQKNKKFKCKGMDICWKIPYNTIIFKFCFL